MKKTWPVILSIVATYTLLFGYLSSTMAPVHAQFNTLTDGSFPSCPDTNGNHLNWNGNLPGGGPTCGTSSSTVVPYKATSAAIGGALLLLGACQSVNATVTGAATTMTAVVSPATDPGNGVQWQAFVSAANTVTVRICALVSVTPVSTVYNVKVLQ